MCEERYFEFIEKKIQLYKRNDAIRTMTERFVIENPSIYEVYIDKRVFKEKFSEDQKLNKYLKYVKDDKIKELFEKAINLSSFRYNEENSISTHMINTQTVNAKWVEKLFLWTEENKIFVYKKESKVNKFKDLLIISGFLNNMLIDIESFYFFIYMISEEQKRTEILNIMKRYRVDFNTPAEILIEQLIKEGQTDWLILDKVTGIEYIKQNKKSFSTVQNEVNVLISPIVAECRKRVSREVRQRNVNATRCYINPANIDEMSGHEFEDFIANLFKLMGYDVTKTKASGDQGVDVVVYKDGEKIAIQTKCYNNALVSNHAIQEVVAGKQFYKADKCMVITTSYFTKSAKELAEVNGVELWDREILIEKMGRF